MISGEVVCEVVIGGLVVVPPFLLAEITDEVIIGVNFMLLHGFMLDLGKKVLSCQNMEIPLSPGY